MMFGELLCLFLHFGYRSKESAAASERIPKWIFMLPCCCDWMATSLMCTAYAYIPVSVAQMCKGTVVVFTCVLSAVILKRRQQCYQLLGVCLVVLGISVVSMSAITSAHSAGRSTNSVVLGVTLCVFAQIFSSTVFVYEEKLMSQYPVQPLEVVGWEGAFGFCVGLLLLTLLYPFGLADTPGAFYQIEQSFTLSLSIVASVFSLAVFNFAAVTVTKNSSAVARTTVKMSSTILIWIVELLCGWNQFNALQLVGFIFVALGTLIYNSIIVIPFLRRLPELPLILGKEREHLEI